MGSAVEVNLSPSCQEGGTDSCEAPGGPIYFFDEDGQFIKIEPIPEPELQPESTKYSRLRSLGRKIMDSLA